jgi:hypothetical protein
MKMTAAWTCTKTATDRYCRAATAAAIGKDYSGNGNNWTPNNISVTAGVTYDSMLDVPTQWADGGNGRGNYATLNPLDVSGVTLSNGNLALTTASGRVRGTIFPSSGKWYFEVSFSAIPSTTAVGIANVTNKINTSNDSQSRAYLSTGSKISNGTSAAYGATWTTNDVIGVAYDIDAGTITFYKNNVSQGTAYTDIAGDSWSPWIQGGFTGTINFGQRPFAYTPPTGFRALNTLNLPTPTILKGNQYFDATTYTGTGASQSITNTGSMQPDFVWIKGRSAAWNNVLRDSVRGADKFLYSNTTAAESTAGSGYSFDLNGFSIGTSGEVNTNTNTYVGWQWKEGATQGFDIVTYTGDGTSNLAVNHSLGVAPRMIILKRRNAADSWPVYHASATSLGQFIVLNSTAAVATTANSWGTSNPNSSSFFVGATSGSATNVSGGTYVAYLFSEVAGFSRAFSYTGNGSADGPFVHLGFRPRFVMVKVSSAVDNWWIQDTSRSPINVSADRLFPNLSNAEAVNSVYNIDFLSNGFKIRGTGTATNDNGATYIGFAFAEVPYKFALGR